MSTAEPQRALLEIHPLISYADGFARQQYYHSRVVQGELPGCVLALQHKPVLTLGKNSDPSMILVSAEELAAAGVDCVHTDRGGEVTAHMPGQLVVYPILPLQNLRLQPKAYVDRMMQAVIACLGSYGIEARVDNEFPGVWVGSEKICAVGARIKERVSMHGLALNVNNRLDLFRQIIPCGIQTRGVTSLSVLRGENQDFVTVQTSLLAYLAEYLGLQYETASSV